MTKACSFYFAHNILLACLLALLPINIKAQDRTDKDCDNGPRIDQLHFETRMGFEGEWNNGQTAHDNTGFKGQYINLRFDGQIVKGLTFSYRQRLNKKTDQTFWDATDWLHLDYSINKRWSISAGKQIVWIGGYEYDRAPIDLYYCSEYWYHIPCYQLGASATYKPASNHALTLQVVNSPFRGWAGNNTYGLNLIWYGKAGFWETIWSTNMFEYARGKWINYIALGNRFNMTRQLRLDVDVTNRASSHQTFLFKDITVTGELSYQPCKAMRSFAKYSFDQNKTNSDADLLVIKGTQIHSASLGLEVSPFKSYREGLRLFATSAYAWGKNPADDGTLHNHQWRFQAGLKWRLDVIDSIRKIIARREKKNTIDKG